VLFIDLDTLIAPDLTGTAVASMLGLSVRSDDATPSVIAHLRDKRILLVFDTCEHLVEAAAPLMARIFADAPQVYMLATSREALRVEGEHVWRRFRRSRSSSSGLWQAGPGWTLATRTLRSLRISAASLMVWRWRSSLRRAELAPTPCSRRRLCWISD
jgi:predicted ATPase